MQGYLWFSKYYLLLIAFLFFRQFFIWKKKRKKDRYCRFVMMNFNGLIILILSIKKLNLKGLKLSNSP